MEGLGVSDLASIPCDDVGYTVMQLYAAWGSDPGGSYWVVGSYESFCQAYIGRLVLEG